MPVYCDVDDRLSYLRQAVSSLWRQTDGNWRLIMVDDGSPDPGTQDLMRALCADDPDRVHALSQVENRGQGRARNRGVEWAHRAGIGVVAFLDSDDEAHPDRVAVTRARFAAEEIDFLYSSFIVIDGDSAPVPIDLLTPSIQEILHAHLDPPEGTDVWRRIGVECGYATLTSTVSVRTDLALAEPFPEERVSEDTHAWFRMTARARWVAFEPSTPGAYRIPQGMPGSSVRQRIGDVYYWEKARVDADGFQAALRLAEGRGDLRAGEGVQHWIAFLDRLAETVTKEGESDLAAQILVHRKRCDDRGIVLPLEVSRAPAPARGSGASED